MKTKIFSLVLLSTLGFASCKKDSKTEPTTVTKATITVRNSLGAPAPGITVYAYDQDTWEVIGDDKLFADGQATTDANGNAEFSNIEYSNAFTMINNNQNNFRFSAHYTINGVAKKKAGSVTVNKGDHAKLTITAD